MKIAVITGASSGIGLLTTVELARSGFQVIATMRDLRRRSGLEQAAGDAGVGPYVDIRRLDITDFDLIPSLIEGVIRDYGRIDVLVNNAGFAVGGFAEDLTLGEIRSQFETNFFGHVAVTKTVLPTMRRQRSGHIIMLSSVSGLHGSPAVSSYSASKFALEGWSESLRLEVNPLGIKVVLVEPGSFQTDIWTRNAYLAQGSLDANSPNRQRAQKMRDRVQAIPKSDPILVAQTVAEIARNPKPRLRYLVGRDAHLRLWLTRLLPWKVHEKMMARLLKID